MFLAVGVEMAGMVDLDDVFDQGDESGEMEECKMLIDIALDTAENECGEGAFNRALERVVNRDNTTANPHEEIKIKHPESQDPSRAIEDAAFGGEFDGGNVMVETMPAGELPPWGDPGVPIADSATPFGYQQATVRMPLEDFRRLQTYIGTELPQPFGDVSERDFWLTNEQRVESVAAVLRGDEEPKEVFGAIPMPYVEIGSDGTLTNTQEGRHRLVAAEEVGLETIPVRIILNTDTEGAGGPE